MTHSGKEQGEIYCHRVPKISRFYPYSNAQRVQPFSAIGFSNYRRLWLFSTPRQLGAYYYISTYIITVTRPGLLSTCTLNRMLRLEHV